MKKILFVLPLAFYLTSCGGCNTSSAEGAADCACDYTKEIVKSMKAGDLDQVQEISKKMESLKKEVDEHIEAGDYSENDVESAMGELSGECGDL